MSTRDADVGRPAPGTPGTPGPPWQAASTFTRALVDDAAIFPPGNAALADAVRAHHGHRASWYGPAIGPLLVRLSDARGLNGLLDDGAELSIGLICPPAAAPSEVVGAITDVQRDRRAVVQALEQPVAGSADLSGLRAVGHEHEALVWAEVPQGCPLDGTLDQRLDDISAGGAGAKYRTGGVTPEAFPTEQQVARFVLGCVARRLPFKLTAGLHHAVRHTAAAQLPDVPALEQHGVLNVVTAVAAAIDGAPEPHVVTLLADRDAGRVAHAVAVLDDAALSRVRQSFVSFGCCGVTDPLTDLVTLGLLTTGPLDQPADKEIS